MKKFIAATAIICSTLFAAGCGDAENIGYVDRNKIITEAPQITALVEEGSKKIEDVENEVKSTMENNPSISDEDREKILSQFDRKVDGINQAYATQIKNKLDTALAEICNSKNVSIVLDNSSMQKILIEGGMDLTDEVIAKLK